MWPRRTYMLAMCLETMGVRVLRVILKWTGMNLLADVVFLILSFYFSR